MEGAVSVSADELLAAPPEDKTQKLIVCCARGKFSVDTAEQLSEMGYDAYSLSGGYAAWLLAVMQKEQADEVSKRVEQSLQKKFRKKIWAAFTKAVKQYELVKENDRIAVCISGGKDSMLMAKLFQELHRHSDFPFEVKVAKPRKRPTSTGGTDASVFAVEGVPTYGFTTDDIKGYNFSYGEIWHTERDLYTKNIPEYQEHTAVVTAIVALGVANLDKQLSREGMYKE